MSTEQSEVSALLAKEQEEKKSILIRTVTEHATATSDFLVLRQIHKALQEGDTISCKVISGGKTNFSYKVYLTGHPELAIFAKICFSYALWNPDRSYVYDLVRADNEFQTMEYFSDMMGPDAPVATPLFCVDVDETSKILAATWAKGDEQLANQFVDGQVDQRLYGKIARALATLNLKDDVDPDFNTHVRPYINTMSPVFQALFPQHLEGDGRMNQFARELGVEEFNGIVDMIFEVNEKREGLIHNDSHVFNILVEAKKGDDLFGPDGTFTLCDWEMTMNGALGNDPGKFIFFPVEAALCHAVQGHKTEALEMLAGTFEFMDTYMECLAAGGKDAAFCESVFRDAIGFLALFCYSLTIQMEIFIEHLPLEGVDDEKRAKALDAIGYVGLRMYHYAWGQCESDVDPRSWLYDLLMSEIETLTPDTRLPRLASSMRGRRVSDASILEEVVAEFRRSKQGKRRTSMYDVHASLVELQ